MLNQLLEFGRVSVVSPDREENPFARIERQRLRYGISKRRLCNAAGIDRHTYYRALEDPGHTVFGTIEKVRAALAELIAAQTEEDIE